MLPALRPTPPARGPLPVQTFLSLYIITLNYNKKIFIMMMAIHCLIILMIWTVMRMRGVVLVYSAADDVNDSEYPPLVGLGEPPVHEQEGLAPDRQKYDDKPKDICDYNDNGIMMTMMAMTLNLSELFLNSCFLGSNFLNCCSQACNLQSFL